MRWKTAILLIYILGLTAVPCSDIYNKCIEPKSHEKELAHNHGQDNDDKCTPFCQCSCCSVPGVKFGFRLPEYNPPFAVITDKNAVIKDCQVISSYCGSIWQPPKFSV